MGYKKQERQNNPVISVAEIILWDDALIAKSGHVIALPLALLERFTVLPPHIPIEVIQIHI